jgi:hypothetical protein
MTTNIQSQVERQTTLLEQAAHKESEIIDKLNAHIYEEISQEANRTEQIERMNRLIIRATTAFAILVIALVAIMELVAASGEGRLLELIVKAVGG